MITLVHSAQGVNEISVITSGTNEYSKQLGSLINL